MAKLTLWEWRTYGYRTVFVSDRKIQRAQEFLGSSDCDPCATSIPLGEMREFRGKLARSAASNQDLASEMRYIDILSVSPGGVVAPSGFLRKLRKSHVDFGDSPETIRAHLITGGPVRQSYTSSYSRVISLVHCLSYHGVPDIMAFLCPDAAPTRRAAAYFPNRVFGDFLFISAMVFFLRSLVFRAMIF